MKDIIEKPSMLQRGIQIILGVLCLPFCLFFIIASISLLIPDTNLSWHAEISMYLIGLVSLFGSIWFSVLAICLIFNKQYPKIPDVQVPPWALILLALFLLVIPIISIFTGTFFEILLINIVLFFSAVGVFRLAREKSFGSMFIKHEYLTAKIRSFGTRMIFFEEGKYIADFDGGPCDLRFNDGKMYSFSEWAPEWVKDTVFPRESAQIACIVDYHYTVVSDEASASGMTFYSDNGEITYYKEGELEVVAHSERTFLGDSEVIICNKRKYRVVRTKKLLSGVAELYENDHSIATISTGLFRQKSIFRNDLPLKDRIFISLLVYMNWPPIPELMKK